MRTSLNDVQLAEVLRLLAAGWMPEAISRAIGCRVGEVTSIRRQSFKRRITPGERAEMNRLYARGVKNAEIAKRFNLSASQVSKYTSDSPQARQAKQLRRSGQSIVEIAQELGVTKTLVSAWTAGEVPANSSLTYGPADMVGIQSLLDKGYSERVIADVLGMSRTRLRGIILAHRGRTNGPE